MNRIVAGVLIGLIPTLAFGHGPSRKKEITTIEINAPADKVWEVVGNYRDMGWHPAIATTEADPGEYKKEVTKRKLTFENGAVITDTLTRHEPDTRTIAFLTNDEDLKDASRRRLFLDHLGRRRWRQVQGRMEGRVLPRLHE